MLPVVSGYFNRNVLNQTIKVCPLLLNYNNGAAIFKCLARLQMLN